MSSDKYILFDLPSKAPNVAWSLNPWKIRLLFNFKGINYDTKWLEYPDIKPTLEPHCGPNHDAGGLWTIPTVKFPDGSYIMDSWAIAERVEKEHPEPSAHLNSPVVSKLKELMPEVMGALRPIYIPNTPKAILSDASLDFWYTTRSKFVGMPLDQFEQDQGGQQAWDKAKPSIQKVEALFNETPGGPFFLGETVSYADFIWVGFLFFIQRQGADKFENLLKASGDAQIHKNMLEAAAPWLERCSH